MLGLLDTNVLSELRKPKVDPQVLSYFATRPVDDHFTSVVILAEIRFGISLQQDLIRRADLSLWLDDDIRPMFRGRVLEVSEAIVFRWRVLLEHGRKAGRTYSQPDLIIAATALEHGLTLVTRNTRDFRDIAGIQLLNPWEPTV